MKQPVIGIQLYTLRDHIQNAADFDSTLARLKAMGVDTVQISGIGDFPAEEQKAVLDKHGMKVCVTHKSYERMTDDLDGLIAEHKIIDCDALGLGGAPGDARTDIKALWSFIDKTNEFGKKLKEHGMTFNYHNHSFEFNKITDDGKTIMDLLIDETDPELFRFIPDVAWVHFAGTDPVEFLHRVKGRVKVVHFKDYIIDENGERHFVSLGQGKVDLEACYKACCELDIPYIMYEQDCDWEQNDPFISTEKSWKFMQGLQ